MLTYEDEALIRNAIWKRIHDKGKTEIADIQVINKPDDSPPHIQVGVWCILKDRIQHEGLVDTRSFFDLPAEFDHKHLLNEIDEVSEQIKEARRQTAASRLLQAGIDLFRKATKGTGLRGRWGSNASQASERH